MKKIGTYSHVKHALAGQDAGYRVSGARPSSGAARSASAGVSNYPNALAPELAAPGDGCAPLNGSGAGAPSFAFLVHRRCADLSIQLRNCALLYALFLAGSASAATTNHWAGGQCQTPVVGSCNWSGAENWLELSAPANDGTVDIVFEGAVGTTPEMDRSWNVHSVSFDITVGASFTCGGGGNALTIQGGGLVNSSLFTQTIGASGDGSPITLGADQSWSADLGDVVIHSSSPVSFNGKTLTVSGVTNTSIFPKIGGSGRLVKEGTGTLFLGQGGAFNTNYTGTVIVNNGTLEIDGSQTIEKASSVTLNGGVVVLNRPNSIGSSNIAMIFNGGELQAIAPNGLVNPSDFFGTLVISNNASIISLAPDDGYSTVLTFARGALNGSGALTIAGWTGSHGQSGSDDRIIIKSRPSAAFLNALHFTGFPTGAVYLATGEIVPPPPVVVTPPVLAAVGRPSGTVFQFSIAGAAGASYTIQKSANLLDWAPILTTNAPGDVFTVSDPNATNSSAFYRVLLNP